MFDKYIELASYTFDLVTNRDARKFTYANELEKRYYTEISDALEAKLMGVICNQEYHKVNDAFSCIDARANVSHCMLTYNNDDIIKCHPKSRGWLADQESIYAKIREHQMILLNRSIDDFYHALSKL